MQVFKHGLLRPYKSDNLRCMPVALIFLGTGSIIFPLALRALVIVPVRRCRRATVKNAPAKAMANVPVKPTLPE